MRKYKETISHRLKVNIETELKRGLNVNGRQTRL